MIFLQLNLFREIIVDNFAGGGGASTGIELATGLSVDVAINHDPDAIAMHKVNHPDTEHYCESVWDIDPRAVVRGRKTALVWLSPDCKHFSKAKGGKPVEKKIRGLAWVAVRWAATVKPRVIILENVEEFKTWGPVLKDGRPDPSKKGKTFKSFVKALERQGYIVDWRELKACDYGAPTIRKRLFLIARCDGKSIVWPSATHGDPKSEEVRKGILKPYRTSGQIIDWSLSCVSIFDRPKPLSPNTMRRVARGVQKFVIDTPRPFITPKDRANTLIQMGYGDPEGRRVLNLNKPLGTITAGGNKFAVASAILSPKGDISKNDKSERVAAFLTKYYGSDIGQSIHDPLHTVTTKDRFGLVTVKGQSHKIIDIGLRMLQPHELFSAMGFPSNYVINKDYEGKTYSKAKQVARCGNAVPPPFAEHIVRANLPELCNNGQKDFRGVVVS
ncbi:DNA cytosine methyltransferase [Priestia aryabhattai]|uniref:DNA cytosine methyltransferase n=1 Tax=Priestia aryabhattai TaxID=412384 RepID=UPI0032E88E02